MEGEDEREAATEDEIIDLATKIARRMVGETGWFPSRASLLRALNQDLRTRGKYTYQQVLAPLMPAIAAHLLTNRWDELEQHFGANLIVCNTVEEIPVTGAAWFIDQLRGTAEDDQSDPVRVTLGCGGTLASWADEVRARIKHRLEIFSGIVLCSDVAQPNLPIAIAARLCGRDDKLHGYQLLEDVVIEEGNPNPNPRYVIRNRLDDKLFHPARQVDYIFCGTGTIGSGTGFGQYASMLKVADALKAHGAIGELFYWPYTAKGFLYDELGLGGNHSDVAAAWQRLDPVLRRFYLKTFTLHWRKDAQRSRGQKPTTVLMAGGRDKYELIWKIFDEFSATHFDVLVTDRGTAEALLAMVPVRDFV